MDISCTSQNSYRSRYPCSDRYSSRCDGRAFSLVAGIPAKVIKTLDESNLDNIHAQAVKYKDLWSKRHNIMPDIDGETYHGEKIV
jgi:hypothetical protein